MLEDKDLLDHLVAQLEAEGRLPGGTLEGEERRRLSAMQRVFGAFRAATARRKMARRGGS